MSANCQIPTPARYAVDMLNYIGYDKDLYGKRVLENSCGEGNILVEIVKRYMEDTDRQGYGREQMILGLERDICAYEVDAGCIAVCRKRLDEVAEQYGIRGVRWNIRNEDYLKAKREKYLFIIGNPPYITYHDLEEEERDYIKKNFSTCTKGRFDYSYAFIQASIESLADGGKLAYLVPHSIAKNKFAGELRRFLLPYLTGIYDYKGTKIFPEALTTPITILCENRKGLTMISYEHVSEGIRKMIPKKNLGKKWIFGNMDSRKNRRFGDYFEISNSVATLYNKAFLLSDAKLAGNYYQVGSFRVEAELVRDAVSVKTIKQDKKNQNRTKIIFPYRVDHGRVLRYPEENFHREFPEACIYLGQFREGMKTRKADKNAAWFEYGRSQAVTRMPGEKLVIPMVITKSVKAYIASADSVIYAGYFITCKKNGSMSLNEAKAILEDPEFYRYVEECGTPTTETSYRISVNDIKDYRFE